MNFAIFENKVLKILKSTGGAGVHTKNAKNSNRINEIIRLCPTPPPSSRNYGIVFLIQTFLDMVDMYLAVLVIVGKYLNMFGQCLGPFFINWGLLTQAAC